MSYRLYKGSRGLGKLRSPHSKKNHGMSGMDGKEFQASAPKLSGQPTSTSNASDKLSSASTHKTITINITAPKVNISKYTQPITRVFSLKYVVIGIGCLLVIVAILAAGKVVYTSINKPDSTSTLGSSSERPQFAILVPKAKLEKPVTIENGYTYDSQRKLVAYGDTWAKSALTFSQQLVPDSFERNPDSLAQTAESINAKDSFNTKKGTAYLATNDSDGQQIVTFTSDNLLVFIRSSQKLDEANWTEYINSLAVKEP